MLLLLSCALTGTALAQGPTSPEAGVETPELASESPAPATRPGGFIQWIGTGFSMHKQNYLLPLTWGNRAHGSEDSELKFQLSFKQRIASSNFFIGYTQKSFWRILDQDDSRPFRETNYNPELFYRYLSSEHPWGSWGADAGYEHESNGAREPTSRSWDRLYLKPFIEYGRLRTDLKLWHRLSEDVKETPDDPAGDENPDIEKFYGYGELRLGYEFANRFQDGHMATLLTRWNFATAKGGLQFDYSLPTPSRNLFLFAHLWTGYGESLIDYNRSLTRYGIGVMFKR
ncbi:phospholipase A [Desulfuromonas versatilis]|uniref:phospholipase A n=1 Tax=Desulfuromonas versatilis TaxID=2802975 RepID=UPI001C84F125|nr:phospholipase A [Desulfuromonas versatilis]